MYSDTTNWLETWKNLQKVKKELTTSSLIPEKDQWLSLYKKISNSRLGKTDKIEKFFNDYMTNLISRLQRKTCTCDCHLVEGLRMHCWDGGCCEETSKFSK